MRSKVRLSNRLCSVPEKHSVVSFVQDIRRSGTEVKLTNFIIEKNVNWKKMQ